MSLRPCTPCDYGYCPYEAEYSYTCEYWCGADEPQDVPEVWGDEEYEDYMHNQPMRDGEEIRSFLNDEE